MGGKIFQESSCINFNEYQILISQLKLQFQFQEPLRLSNKTVYSDIDLILKINDINSFEIECKEIDIGSKRFHNTVYSDFKSKHFLFGSVQIDLLPCINFEFTRVFYSYEIANVFFKKLVTCWDKNIKMTSIGLIISSKKLIKEISVDSILLKNNNYLITDINFLFENLKLNKKRYFEGFNDCIELLDYFKTSIYFDKIYFKDNASFRYECSRLLNLQKLVDLKLINVV